MNKLYLHQYLSIVLTLIFVVLFANNAYLTFLLFDLTSKNPQVFEDIGFKIKFFETIFFAIIYVSVAIYMLVMSLMKFELLEYGKGSKSKKDSDEE